MYIPLDTYFTPAIRCWTNAVLMTQHRPGVVFIFLIETFDLVGPFFFFEQENLIYIPFGFL